MGFASFGGRSILVRLREAESIWEIRSGQWRRRRRRRTPVNEEEEGYGAVS
jgi:hypothetical protein